MKKILILRLSSFGDVAQCLPVASSLAKLPDAPDLHWVIRSDLKDLPAASPDIQKIWTLDRKSGFSGLLTLCRNLSGEKFDLVYDAHNNIRSTFIRLYLFVLKPNIRFVTRSKSRIRRFLLFKLRINTFPKPFFGRNSFLAPIKKWLPISPEFAPVKLKPTCISNFHFADNHNVNGNPIVTGDLTITRNSNNTTKPYIAIAPSAAWALKTWPVDHWKNLLKMLASALPQYQIFVLGGPDDKCCKEIVEVNPQQAFDLSGKLSWAETISIVQNAKLLISGDTGVLHLADIMQTPAIALIGPTAFGFPSSPTTKTLEVSLSCRPCTKDGRGKCSNIIYQKCLVDINPSTIAAEAQIILNNESQQLKSLTP